MNYIKHLSAFFDQVSTDDRLNPTHISLYISLFQFWNAYRFKNPLSISRNEVMKISKISSKVTYHKCIRELNDYGYLSYVPSYNPFRGSLVYMFKFWTSSEQVLHHHHTKKQTSTEQALVPYINNTNNNKLKTKENESAPTSNFEYEAYPPLESLSRNFGRAGGAYKLKVAQKNKNENESQLEAILCPPLESLSRTFGRAGGGNTKILRNKLDSFRIPDINQVRSHFQTLSAPSLEADKFFNHYTSNGWLLGGKTSMKDWKAAANKWMLNIPNYDQPKTKQHAATRKDYNEAL